jgi:hypothetical protein
LVSGTPHFIGVGSCGEAAIYCPQNRACGFTDGPAEFREKAKERDPAKVANAIEVAVRGLETLRKYTNLGKRQQTWTLSLDQDPLGEAEAQQRRAASMAAELQARKAAAATANTPATGSLE